MGRASRKQPKRRREYRSLPPPSSPRVPAPRMGDGAVELGDGCRVHHTVERTVRTNDEKRGERLDAEIAEGLGVGTDGGVGRGQTSDEGGQFGRGGLGLVGGEADEG